ncbi:MAG: DUF6580 family putative transport protein, partial [Planctomycetota bacterium]|nr:DUF6580 family putative transport protein [Planctomycetota bacterium]
MSDRFKTTFFFLLVACGVGLRLLCRDIPNFAPVAALSLFSGFLFRNWLVAALVPISVLAISNLQLGGYESGPVMLSVYACFLLPSLIGKKFLQTDSSESIPILSALGFSLGGSFLFFLVTNYSAWIAWYPKTLEGLIDCYGAAIPFFRHTLLGDSFF